MTSIKSPNKSTRTRKTFEQIWLKKIQTIDTLAQQSLSKKNNFLKHLKVKKNKEIQQKRWNANGILPCLLVFIKTGLYRNDKLYIF